ncbi:hypothetical protein BGX23_000925 [Mortierella sp. AD031]|nr:hypothetical protein BGX23_000925 [Mortierella sp. AD031]
MESFVSRKRISASNELQPLNLRLRNAFVVARYDHFETEKKLDEIADSADAIVKHARLKIPSRHGESPMNDLRYHAFSLAYEVRKVTTGQCTK